MPDKLMRAQITIPLDSGLPEDSLVNTLYFDGDNDLDGAATDADYHETAFSAIQDFFQAVAPQLMPQTVGPEVTVKIYDMRDATPRVPEFVDTFGITPKGAPPIPNEVALCLSFAAAPTSGVAQSRRRGRIFLGPVANDTDVLELVGSQSRPRLLMREAICAAAASMKQTDLPIGIGGSVRWAVYSPRTDVTSSVDDAFNDVETGWVDNAWDTQRRRGAGPTSRAVFS